MHYLLRVLSNLKISNFTIFFYHMNQCGTNRFMPRKNPKIEKDLFNFFLRKKAIFSAFFQDFAPKSVIFVNFVAVFAKFSKKTRLNRFSARQTSSARRTGSCRTGWYVIQVEFHVRVSFPLKRTFFITNFNFHNPQVSIANISQLQTFLSKNQCGTNRFAALNWFVPRWTGSTAFLWKIWKKLHQNWRKWPISAKNPGKLPKI